MDGSIYHADHKMRVVDGLITGLHEPQSTHLSMLAALAGFELLSITYRELKKVLMARIRRSAPDPALS